MATEGKEESVEGERENRGGFGMLSIGECTEDYWQFNQGKAIESACMRVWIDWKTSGRALKLETLFSEVSEQSIPGVKGAFNDI